MARDTIGMGDPDYLAKYAERVQSLTVKELQQAAERFLQKDRLITVKLLPADEDHPVTDMTRPDEAAAPDDLPEAPITLDNRRVLEALNQHLAETDAPTREFTVEQPVKYELDNGLRLIVQRSTVVPAVSMQMYWLGGLLGDEPGREGTANAMAAMMTRGTQNYSADQLASAVESLGADLSADAGNNTTFVRASALKQDWRRVMDLMAEVTLRPTFPAEEWAKLQPRLKAAVDRQTDRWSGELQQHFRATYFGEHPWSQTPLGRSSVIESLDAAALTKHHDTHLAGGRAVMAVVGDVDPEAVREQVKALFGEMPARAEASFDPPEPARPGASLEQVSTEKRVAAVQIGYGPGLKRNNPDYPAMAVLGNVLSDFPGGWLEQQLRGQGGGLAYAVGAYTQTGMVPGYFTVLFNTSPGAAPEALEKAMQVVERARNEKISEGNLQRAQAKTLTGEFMSRQSNSGRATGMALNELYGVGDLQGERFVRQVKQLDAEALKRVANEYLHNPVVVVMSHAPIPQASLHEAVDGQIATGDGEGRPEPNQREGAATQPASSG